MNCNSIRNGLILLALFCGADIEIKPLPGFSFLVSGFSLLVLVLALALALVSTFASQRKSDMNDRLMTTMPERLFWLQT